MQPRKLAYKDLTRLAQEQGYITFDDISDCADLYALPDQDFDWLTNSLLTRGLIIYEEPPANQSSDANEEDYDDFAQADYDAMYKRIVELNPSLEEFVNKIRKIIPPQRREFQRLIYHVIEGNLFARTRMIEMYLRLALRIALQRTEKYDQDLEETIENGIIGLITAVDKYDPRTDGPFSSYASMWVLQNINRELTNQRPLVYYPVHRKEDFLTMYPIFKDEGFLESITFLYSKKALQQTCKRLLCSKEVAKHTIDQMVPLESFDAIIEEIRTQEPSPEPLHPIAYAAFDDLTISESEALAPIFENVQKHIVDKALKTLTPREAEVIRLRYGFDGERKTLEDVGKVIGVTRERIRQIEKKAFAKLRRNGDLIRAWDQSLPFQDSLF